MHLATAPAEATVAGAAVSADVVCLPDGSWNVVVVLRRSPAPDLIDASEVEVELHYTGGEARLPITRPHGPLAEAGGSLAMSTNAPFRFSPMSAQPSELVVRWRGQPARFRLVPVR
jgi:hypothetical protein